MDQKLSTNVANLKRRKISRPNVAPPPDRVRLERVLGLTVNCGASLSCDSENGIIAYPAGCTIVLYSTKKNRQAHIINSSKKQISCLAFSSDGRYLATGETGHQPAVRVWDAQERTQLAELPGHKFGIVCVAFSPNMKYLVSVGNHHDMVVNVWNWKNNSKVASNKVSSKVKAVSFSENGSYFVTVGVRHVKFWYLERNKASPKYQDTVPLQGRSAILSEQRNNNFCDVVCGSGPTASSTFCITQSGLLCEFNSRRLLEKWVELKTQSATSMALGNNCIYVGCADGIVRGFQADSLTYLFTLPRPHYLGVDVAAGLTPAHMMTTPVGAKYPEAIALCFDSNENRLTCIYSDHSLYQWDVSDFKKIGKVASFLYHSSCVWGIEVYPVLKSGSPSLPPDTFMTCGSDDTVRIWNLDPNMPNDMTPYRRNIYSQELLKILYIDPEYQYLCDNELNFGQSEKAESQMEGKNGVRVIRISPDGRHLAVGDRRGNLKVYRVNDSFLLRELEAHDGDILALEYSNNDPRGPYFLATASRDRIIHVLDVDHMYEPVCSMEGHSSAVTAIKFACNSNNGELTMLSCGSDKSIIFRKYQPESGELFVRTNCVAAQMTLYDMEMDPLGRCVYTACQDRQIRVYNLKDGKLKKCYKGALGDDGTLIKVQLENSGSYVATSCSDKNLAVFDVRTGDCVASMFGHGELVTGMKFSNDFRHLITVSGDGCIFVWRLSADLTNQMLSKLAVMEKRLMSSQTTGGIDGDEDTDDTASEFSEDPTNPVTLFEDPADTADLPSWAKRQLGHHGIEDTPPDLQKSHRPAGKWGQRLGPEGGAALAERKTSREFVVTDEIFLGPGNSDLIKEKFFTDAQGKSPIGPVCHSRGGNDQMVNNFGSLANVRLIGDDDNANDSNRNRSSLIFYPDTNSNLLPTEASNFEVKERSLEASKLKSYNRADTLGNELSDDEEGNMVRGRSSSTLNLKEGLATPDRDEFHPRQHQIILEAYENLNESNSMSPESSQFERNSTNRNSITSKYLQKNVSGRFNSDDSPIAHINNNYSNQMGPSFGTAPVRAMVSQVEALKNQFEYGSPLASSSVAMATGGGLSRPSSSADVPSQIRNQTTRSKWQPSPANSSPFINNNYQTNESPEQKSTNAAPSWSYKPPIANKPTFLTNPNLDIDPKNVLRAKNLSDLAKDRSRRRTMSSFACTSPDDEYIEDDIGRRRSKSPAASLLSRRDSTNSVFSSASMVTRSCGMGRELMTSSGRPPFNYFNGSTSTLTSTGIGPSNGRLSTSVSMSSLIARPDNETDSNNPTLKRISDIRDRLRKSQENLALSTALEPTSPSAVYSDGRSKSIGSLTHAQRQESRYHGNGNSVADSRPTSGVSPSPLASTLRNARELTKSMGNLYSQSAGTNGARRDRTPTRSLADTLKDFRKISNPDLSREIPVDDDGDSEFRRKNKNVPPRQAGSFYSPTSTSQLTLNTSSTTLPRYRKASGVVQKKAAQRRLHNNQLERASASGDSEDSSDTSSPYMKAPIARSASGLINKRNALSGEQHYASSSPRRSPSSLLSNTAAAAVTSTPMRPPEIQQQRRNSSHLLAKILSDEGAEMEKASNYSPRVTGGSSLVASEGSESFDGHYEKMSSHCKDSVGQFRTVLDKILQSYQMVTNDADLTDGDRENLLSLLKGELEEARRRINHTLNQQQASFFVRHQPDGGVDEPQVLSPSMNSIPVAGDPAASAFLQQYSDILVNMIQQKMSGGGGAPQK